MNNKTKSEKFRALSIVALITALLSFGMAAVLLSPISSPPFSHILSEILLYGAPFLSIVAVVCGSIDLQKIQSGRYKSKGRGFDITGIVLGGIFLLFISVFLLGELIFPH